MNPLDESQGVFLFHSLFLDLLTESVKNEFKGAYREGMLVHSLELLRLPLRVRVDHKVVSVGELGRHKEGDPENHVRDQALTLIVAFVARI